MPDPNTQEESQLTIEPNYPFNLFKHTSQNYRNPVKRCNKNVTTVRNGNQILCLQHNKSNQNPNNATPTKPKLQLYVKKYSISKYTYCGAQYVGYSMRQLRERFTEHETTYKSPVGRHCLAYYDHFNELTIQAPASETNPELWLKQQEYYCHEFVN